MVSVSRSSIDREGCESESERKRRIGGSIQRTTHVWGSWKWALGGPTHTRDLNVDWLAWVSLLLVVEGDVLVILAFCVLSVFKERLDSNKLSTNSFENFGVLVGDAHDHGMVIQIQWIKYKFQFHLYKGV